MNDNNKTYTAEIKINYSDGEISILEKSFDEFTKALETCRLIRKNAGVNFAGSVIRENEWANELYHSTTAGVEYFTAIRERDDYGEIILAARGNSKRLTRI